jgi:urea ABC transporter ATP-binding protein UrtE
MLTIDKLTAAYGSAQVLNGASIELRARECVALLGRNGVGKTTFLKSIMGIIRVTGGRCYFAGQVISGMPTFKIARLGIAYVPQGRGIFDKLTVEENLRMGLTANATSDADIPEFVFSRFPILKERRRQLAGTLSGGQKQQLAVSRALCGAPKILLLDEPSEGIQPNIVEELAVFLRELIEDRGISVLIVEQNLEMVRMFADRFAVMVKGTIIHSGEKDALSDERALEEFLFV